MELSQSQVQVFMSLVVILAAALVALICDFLKRSNEQLRELAVELRVRREENQRIWQKWPARSSPKPEAPAQRSAASLPERKRATSPDATPAMERGAQLASSPQVSPAADRESSPKSRPARFVKYTKDWDTLLATRSKQKSSEKPQPQSIPPGFHEGPVLTQMVQARQPVSGLVVSIGATAPRSAGDSLPPEVRAAVQSLLGPGDFGCQSGGEEFLLIFPGEHGVAARRKLNQIARDLWDFQLRLLGSAPVLFSWGGVEVHGDPIDEAIASANERMQETRSGRKLSAEPATELRHAG